MCNQVCLRMFQQQWGLVANLSFFENKLWCSNTCLHPQIKPILSDVHTGSKNYAAVTTSDQIYLTVLDLKKREFSALFRGFEPFNDKGKLCKTAPHCIIECYINECKLVSLMLYIYSSVSIQALWAATFTAQYISMLWKSTQPTFSLKPQWMSASVI